MSINTQGGNLILVESNGNLSSFIEISLNEVGNGAYFVFHPDLNTPFGEIISKNNMLNELKGFCIPRGEILGLGQLLIDLANDMNRTVLYEEVEDEENID